MMKVDVVLVRLFFLVVFLFALPALSSTHTDQGKALMYIRASFTNLPNISPDSENDSPGPPNAYCDPSGNSCPSSALAVSMNFSKQDVGGKISPAIGDLTDLHTLDLHGNKITGRIPDEIGNCLTLVILDLSDNQLYGEIPSSISKLKNLQLLSLRGNMFTGKIPPKISLIQSLTVLDLSFNQLSGRIPEQLVQLQHLSSLILNNNKLRGGIPEQLKKRSDLGKLYVSYNSTGYVPAGRKLLLLTAV